MSRQTAARRRVLHVAAVLAALSAAGPARPAVAGGARPARRAVPAGPARPGGRGRGSWQRLRQQQRRLGRFAHPGELAGGIVRAILPARFETGIPTLALEHRAQPGTWGRQRKSQWCWAAGSQMILNYIGLPVSQEAVIQRAYGTALNRPASPAEIAATLDGWRVADATGRPHVVAARAYDHGLPTATVLRDLTAQRPLIVGLRNPGGDGGHAYVLTSVRYDLDALGRPVARSAVLRDPWPDNPSTVELSWAEIHQRFLGAVRIDVARLAR